MPGRPVDSVEAPYSWMNISWQGTPHPFGVLFQKIFVEQSVAPPFPVYRTFVAKQEDIVGAYSGPVDYYWLTKAMYNLAEDPQNWRAGFDPIGELAR